MRIVTYDQSEAARFASANGPDRAVVNIASSGVEVGADLVGGKDTDVEGELNVTRRECILRWVSNTRGCWGRFRWRKSLGPSAERAFEVDVIRRQ